MPPVLLVVPRRSGEVPTLNTEAVRACAHIMGNGKEICISEVVRTGHAEIAAIYDSE